MDVEYFQKTFHFTPESKLSLYAQLASYIRVQIQAGVLQPGDKMIPENCISELLGISRTTVRQCMNRLVEEGLLIRYRGKGTFITDRKQRRNISYVYGYTDNLLEAGFTPSSIIMEQRVVEVTDPQIREKLMLPQGQTQAFFLSRLRCANGEPIIQENAYIPYYLCNGIEQINFESASLYQVLSSRFSITIDHVTERIDSVIVDKHIAGLLRCSTDRPVPGYKLEHISYLDSGYVVEVTTSIARADQCSFYLEFSKSGGRSNFYFTRQMNI
ncbi:GntR family transcriptional regulator [Zongyangia hominis]|uniref:GntR family transcriptional regulator n=1 Tax=Zongyangia hominis TaxID=2763677 RepID=A0A926EC74_9FIRM|nr:GntR family transcriptional regulator [Zongyangia hominis]MBC8571222.1 GntR family transcriptional regulator [Zongyangia hominis]